MQGSGVIGGYRRIFRDKQSLKSAAQYNSRPQESKEEKIELDEKGLTLGEFTY